MRRAALLLILLPACALSRSVQNAADATKDLADEIKAKVVPAVVELAASGKRSTDALGDLWDWLRKQAAWAGWGALILTSGKSAWRWVRGLTMVRKPRRRRRPR